MIGLDTNVLLRYIVEDDLAQLRRAAECIEQRLTKNNPGFISVVVMVETVWALKHVYSLGDDQIAAAIQRILQIEVFLIEHRLAIYIAMKALTQRRGSFADALIGAISRRVGCTRTLTFDHKAVRLPGFELL